MILAFAGDYIDMGETIDKKQSYLNGACSAWNIAILPKSKREKALNEYLIAYKKYNPEAKDISNVKHDMKLLIIQKIKMFPRIKLTIANAELQQEGDEFTVLAASFSNE